MDDRMIVVYAASRNLYPWLPMAYMSLLKHNPEAGIVVYAASRNLYPWLPMAYMSLLKHNPEAGVVCLIEDDELPYEVPHNVGFVNVSNQVVHGRWLGRRYDFKEYKYVIVPYDATTFDNPDNLFCSVCNTPALSNGAENDVPSNYCPDCGAKMDGDQRRAFADQSGAEVADGQWVSCPNYGARMDGEVE